METDAAKCIRMGWGVGTLLEGTEYAGDWSATDVIRITGIGEECVFVRHILHNGKPLVGHEHRWTLGYREWKRVGPATCPDCGQDIGEGSGVYCPECQRHVCEYCWDANGWQCDRCTAVEGIR